METGTRSLDLVFGVSCGEEWDVYFNTNENMKKQFDAEGIQIPVPRRDVHLHQA